MGQQFRNTRTDDIITVSGPVADHYAEKAGWEAVETVAVGELKGPKLDAALEANGLSKAGTADEKRARLAEHLADDTNTAGSPVEGGQPPVEPDVEQVITTVPSQDQQ